jgi:peroxiredoxin
MKNLLIIFAVLLFLFTDNGVEAQTVWVKGIAENRPFEKVRLIAFEDNFSKLPKEVAEVMTDESGRFSVGVGIKAVTYMVFNMGLSKAGIYFKPHAHYELLIPDDTLSKGSVFDQSPLPLILTNTDDGGLNEKISRFNRIYSGFLGNHYQEFLSRRNKQLISDFKNLIASEISDVKEPYLKNYIKYSVAQLEWFGKVKSERAILKEYFVDEKILYGNIQYADFFREFFKEYFHTHFYGRYFYSLREAIVQQSLQTVDSLFLKDELLESREELRQLIMVNVLADLYFDRNFNRRGVIGLLDKISDASSYDMIRKIARHFVKKLTKMQPGTPAPEFTLPLANGENRSLKDWEGRFVIMDFMKGDCAVCMAHLTFLKDMQSRLGSKVVIVLMVYGKDASKVSAWVKEEQLNWPVLFVGKRLDILDAYDVVVFPTYVLLNPDGTVGKAPAGMADETLESEINRLIFQWKRSKDGK